MKVFNVKKSMKYKTFAIIAMAAVLAGCTNVSKEQGGTAIGAIAGAVLGKQMGGDKGMVLGALAGGVLGNRIGAHMDEQDRRTLAVLEQRALDTGDVGSFVTQKSKAKVTVVASPANLGKRQDFVLSTSLTPYPLVAVDPITIAAFVDTPLYNRIDEKDRPKMMIQKGVPMRITASVLNENWAVVGDGNVGLGYVPRRYLDPSIVARVRATPHKIAAKQKPMPSTVATTSKAASDTTLPTVGKEQYEQEMSALSAASKSRNGGQGMAPANAVRASPALVQVVQASTECKVVTRKVEAGGQNAPITETVKYCKEPPKGWQTQAA